MHISRLPSLKWKRLLSLKIRSFSEGCCRQMLFTRNHPLRPKDKNQLMWQQLLTVQQEVNHKIPLKNWGKNKDNQQNSRRSRKIDFFSFVFCNNRTNLNMYIFYTSHILSPTWRPQNAKNHQQFETSCRELKHTDVLIFFTKRKQNLLISGDT